MKGFLRKIDEINSLYLGIILLIVSIVIAVSIVSSVNYIARAKCMASDMPRRWHSAMCEEYENGEWIEINPFNVDTIDYNEAGEAIE